MDPVGIGAVGAVLLVALAGGGAWKRSNGRLRNVPVDSGRKLSDPAGLLIPAQDGVGGGRRRGGDSAAGTTLAPAMLAGLGVEPGERATLLQFSSSHCAPCRAVSRMSAEIADEVPGVRHVEVDAEQHLDVVRTLGIWRTPTLLVLDRDGRVLKRATGVPQKPRLIAAVTRTL